MSGLDPDAMSSILIPASSWEVLAQKLKIVLLMSVLSVALLFTSAGATLESDVSAIKSDVSSIKTTNSNIYTRLGTTNTNLSTIITSLNAMGTDIDYIRTYTSGINTIINQLGVSGTIGQKVSSMDTLLGLIETQTDDVEGYTHNLDINVAKIVGFLANSHHIALETASEDTVDQATSMYGSQPNGQSTSKNAADISGFSSSVSSALSTGVDSSDAFSFLDSGDPEYDPSVLPDSRDRSIFAFFSRDTLIDLDPSLNTRSPQPVVVDYFNPNFNSINSHMNGDDQR